MAIELVILITDLDQGGAPQVVRTLARGLRARVEEGGGGAVFGVRVVSIAPLRAGGVWEELRAEGVEVESLGVGSVWGMVRAFGRWRKYVRRVRPAVVHSVLIHANALATLGRWVGGLNRVNKRKIMYIHAIHTMQTRPRWHWWLQRGLLRCGGADGLVAVNPGILRRLGLTEGAGRVEGGSRYVTIPNGIEVARFAQAEGGMGEAPLGSTFQGNAGKSGYRIGFVGRFDRVKGLERLLEAVAILKRKYLVDSQLQLFMVGYGEQEQELKNCAKTLGLGEEVVFPGATKVPERWYKSFDLMVLPSVVEAFPLTLVEGLAAGVPLVVVDSPAVRYVLGAAAETGVLGGPELGIGVVKSADPECLAVVIKEVMDAELGDQSKRILRQKARQKWAEKYSEEAMLKGYEKIFKLFLQKELNN